MKYENRLLASDIEAIGFYDKVKTKEDIHCLCSIDVETNEVLLFHDNPEFDLQEVFDPYDEKYYTIPKRLGTLEEGIDYWKKATSKGSKLIIHNAHTYDRPVIDKIWPDNGIDFDAYQDTFVESKLQWFERPTPRGCKSPHGLKAYGVLSGVNKPEVTDWDTMDAFKLHRVIEDCKIQAYTYKYLKKERDYLQNKFGINFSVAYKIESMYAAECFEQEVRGAKLNVEGAKKCIADLDDKIDNLTFEIEPYLPLQIKGKSSAKLSKTEIAELFGYCSKNIKDDYVKKKKDGQVVDALVKPYFKPITKWTNVTKGNKYSGFNLSYGDTPSFAKKKELTDWIKENHPETKTKEWDIVKEETKTEVLNTNTCEWFSLDKEDTDKIAGPFTKIEVHETKLTQTDVVKKYLIQLGWKTAEEWNLKKDVYGNFIKVEKKTEVRWPENASPNNQMVHTIEKGGFMVSSPKLSEDDYNQLPEGIGKKIAEYNTYVHRRRFLQNPKDPENKGLISYVREDGRIPCGVNNFGTRSGRASHRVWVNAPSESALYGEEIRKLIIPEEGYSLVGVDMKSAQLSIAAYYANNEEYYNTVATGQEEDEDHNYVGQSAHCVNARMFGLVTPEEFKEAVIKQDPDLIKKISLLRKKSKGGSFAVIFGASGKKVAGTIGIPEKEGNKAKKQFLEQMGLADTIEVLGDFESQYPYKKGFYLPLAFGYWLWNDSPHKSVNTIVQGFEALAQKLAAIRVSKVLKENGLEDKAYKIMDYHDELLYEVLYGYEDTVGKIIGDAYTWAAGQIFKDDLKRPNLFPNYNPPKFSIDLNGGYKVGDNYLAVH